jgi:hypothetical protein
LLCLKDHRFAASGVKRRYILNTPKVVSGIGALRAADKPRPSTMR